MAQAEVEFIYNNSKTKIQCKAEDRMEDIIEKFIIKCQKNKDSIYFLCNGALLDGELTFAEISKDKDNNLIKIQAFDNQDDNEKCSSIKKSKHVICPECKENSRISIKDFKISLYECKNNHKTEDLQLNEFEKTQNIDESEIICSNCKRAKSDIFGHTFYICCTCKMNLCPLCIESHKTHYKIDYDDKDFYCIDHSEAYIYYCNDCKKDICVLCESQHFGHKTITYGSIMPDVEGAQKELNNLKERIKDFKKNIKSIVTKLNRLSENLDTYFKLYSNMINNFDIKKRNYSVLQNITDIKTHNNNFMRNITEIINDNNLKTKFNDLMEMYKKMSFKENKIDEENETNEPGKEENNKKENEESNNVDKIEETNSDNIKRFDPSDNKYENFKISQLKELNSFSTKYDIEMLMILHDRRLLSHQRYCNENGDNLYKICVYNLNNGVICDINFDTDSMNCIHQMNDDNIILFSSRKIKIFKIKKKSIEEIDCIEQKTSDIFKIMNERFILRRYDEYQIFAYENGKLKNCNKNFEIKDDDWGFEDLCQINENEIAVYSYKDGKLFGSNAFLYFYNIKDTKLIKNLKLGGYDCGSKIFLANKNNLIVERNRKLMIIDPKNRVILKEFKTDIEYFSIDKIIRLNDNAFLAVDGSEIYQYEIANNKIKFIEKKKIKNDIIEKYPDNQLLISYDKDVFIYGQ